MHHYLRILGYVLAGALIAGQAAAVDAKNSYLILGPGAYSCQRIISDLARDAKDKNPASTIIYSNWLAGNLTSYNRDSRGTYSILGDETFHDAFAWTVQYCHDHPDKIFAGAADALVLKLKPQRLTSMPLPHHDEDSDKDDKEDDDDKEEGNR
jgi:hypothetical protein